MSDKGGGIPKEIVDRVREETDIVKVIGRDVELKKKGSAWVGLCPFHDEKTPSFRVDVARHTYKCFGCDQRGDVIAWLMAKKGLSFPEAVRALASELSIDVPAAEEALPPPEPGRLDVAVEWSALRGVTEPAALAAWLVGRGVHPAIAEAAGHCEGVVYAPTRPYGELARLMAHSRVGIALRDERGKVVDVERRCHLPPAEITAQGRFKSARLKPEDRGELREKAYFGDLSRVREAVLKGRKLYIAEGGPDWWVADTLCQMAGDGIALGAGTGDLPDLGRTLRRILTSMPERRDEPPPVVVLIPDLGDGNRGGERAMLEVAGQLTRVAVCRWAPPVTEHRAEWQPRLRYIGKRWRAVPGPGRSGVKTDLGDLAALPPAQVRDVLDASSPVLDEGPRPEGSSDPWRPADFDRLRRFVEALPLATIADALLWRMGKHGLTKYTTPETTWWTGELATEWFSRRGARYGHDQAEHALVYWPHTAAGEKRLFRLDSRKWSRVLYQEGRLRAGSVAGQEVMQAMEAMCLAGRPMTVRPWSYTSDREVRLHLHDDLDRVAVARADGVHVEPNAAAELHDTSPDVHGITWLPDVDMGAAIRLYYERVGRWLTCDPIDRVTVLSWGVLSFARHILTLRPILTFNGPAGVGKSVAARLLAVLVFGWKRLLARPTPVSLYAAGDHPITAIDNVEERNRASVEDYLLIAATGAHRTIGTKEGGIHAQHVDTFAILTSIVVSGRYELMTRMLVIDNGRQHGDAAFVEEDVVSALKADRSTILCGLLHLWQRVWQRWDDVKRLAATVSETHIAWRQRESLAAMALIGAELGGRDIRITSSTSAQLLAAMLERLEARVGHVAVQTDPIVFGLQALLRAWNRVVWGPGQYWQQWLEEEVAGCQPVFLHHSGDRATDKRGDARVRRRHVDGKGEPLSWPVVAGFIGTHDDLHADIMLALRPTGLAVRFEADIPDGNALESRFRQVAAEGWCREYVDRPRSKGGRRPSRYRFFTLEAIGEEDEGTRPTREEGEP